MIEFTDKRGFVHEVKQFNVNLADYLLGFRDHYRSGTLHFLGFVLPSREILELEVHVFGQKRYVMSLTTFVVDGREVNGHHEHDVEEFRKYSEFGLFKSLCSPFDGNEEP